MLWLGKGVGGEAKSLKNSYRLMYLTTTGPGLEPRQLHQLEDNTSDWMTWDLNPGISLGKSRDSPLC